MMDDDSPPLTATRRIHLRVYGTVQGVGFRYFASRAARNAGIEAGWVRNRVDGSLELEAQGSEAALASMRQQIAQGPPLAVVTRVEDLPTGSSRLPRPFAVLG